MFFSIVLKHVIRVNCQVLPVSKSSQMITFTFEEGIVATLRTSGTEPKIKYYTEICGNPGKEYAEYVETFSIF